MRRRKNPPLDLTPSLRVRGLTFDVMAHAYLEDYALSAVPDDDDRQARVEHLREFFGGWAAEVIRADAWRW